MSRQNNERPFIIDDNSFSAFIIYCRWSPQGGCRGQSLVTSNFATCLKVNRKTALVSPAGLMTGQSHHGQGRDGWRRWWWRWWREIKKKIKDARACSWVCAQFAFYHMCRSVNEGAANDAYGTCEDPLTPSYTPAPPPLTSSLSSVNEHARLYLEGSWCHKWFERWAYNCWSRFVWQSDKLRTAPATHWDLQATS